MNIDIYKYIYVCQRHRNDIWRVLGVCLPAATLVSKVLSCTWNRGSDLFQEVSGFRTGIGLLCSAKIICMFNCLVPFVLLLSYPCL